MKRTVVMLAIACAAGPALADRPPVAPPGLDAAAFAKLYARAQATHTDALVLMREGKLLGEWYFGRERGRIETMSMTKSVVGLAIGMLIAAGKIKSVDQPISDFYPEWRQGQKRAITIRQVMSQTSGLQNDQSPRTEIYPAPDVVRLALAAELATAPGSAWTYNNKAVNVLAGVIRIASGKRLDAYVQGALFRPLGITDVEWDTDQVGNPYAMSGLKLRATDLAKLGQLVLDHGMWQGKQLVPRAWLDTACTPSQPYAVNYGLLWWLVEDVVTLAPDIELPGPVHGCYADGWLGQYIVVIPDGKLVAVRQMRRPDGTGRDLDRLDAFAEFPTAVRALVAPPAPPAP